MHCASFSQSFAVIQVSKNKNSTLGTSPSPSVVPTNQDITAKHIPKCLRLGTQRAKQAQLSPASAWTKNFEFFNLVKLVLASFVSGINYNL